MEPKLLQLVDDIYQAAAAPDSAATLAGAVAKTFGADSCLMVFRRQRPGATPELSGMLSATENFTDWARSAYLEHYHGVDPWYERGWCKGIPAVVLGQELVDSKYVMCTEWADYLRATDTFHVLGAHFPIVGQTLGVIGIHRTAGQAEFNDSDRRKMALLLPHFARALQLRERFKSLEERGALSLELLDKLGVGIVLVSEKCRVLFVNRAADRLLTRPFSLTVTRGQLKAQRPDESCTLQRMVAATRTGNAASGAGGTIYLTHPRGAKQPVLIAPMPSDRREVGWPMFATAVIFSAPDEQGAVAGHHLAQRYQLTPAESHLLSALVAGQELSNYAATRNIGVSTAKSHLKSLFRKTGCRRQTDLVRTVLSDPLLRVFEAAVE